MKEEQISEELIEKYISQGQDFEKILYRALREACAMHKIPDRMILVTVGKFFTQIALQANVSREDFLEGIASTYDILTQGVEDE